MGKVIDSFVTELDTEEFRDELEKLLNKFSIDNTVGTPDYLLCNYIINCIINYAHTKQRTDAWS